MLHPLNQVICTRDDIMICLIKCGLPRLTSFKLWSSLRKGKVARSWAEFKKDNGREKGVRWYIDSYNQ